MTDITPIRLGISTDGGCFQEPGAEQLMDYKLQTLNGLFEMFHPNLALGDGYQNAIAEEILPFIGTGDLVTTLERFCRVSNNPTEALRLFYSYCIENLPGLET